MKFLWNYCDSKIYKPISVMELVRGTVNRMTILVIGIGIVVLSNDILTISIQAKIYII